MRIVSLIPSGTEIVHALGQTKNLVGRSHECDYPPGVTKLPVCTEAKLRTDVPSREIDRQVRAIIEKALSVYRVFADTLKNLKPDVVITQSQCKLCAVSVEDVEEAVCNFVDSKPRIVALEPMQLSDVWKDIERVAEALDIPDKGRPVIDRLQQRLADIAQKTKSLPDKPTVALVEWIDPLMTGGNWMPELVDIAGGVNLLSEAGKHSPGITLQDLQEKDPDVIVVIPCGFDIPRIRQEMGSLTQQPGWNKLKAVQNGQVYIADGNQFFNRPGPRLVESAEILAEILHPKKFNFGHQGVNWYRFAGNDGGGQAEAKTVAVV